MAINAGRLTTLVIVGVALAAAAIAWVHQLHYGDQVLAQWGPQVASRIRSAEQVELLLLEPMPSRDPENDAPSGTDSARAGAAPLAPARSSRATERQRLQDGDRSYAVVGRIHLTGAPGLVHLRQALISDPSYRWDGPSAGISDQQRPTWQYGLRFVTEQGDVLMLLDLQSERLGLAGQSEWISCEPIAAGLRRFLQEQLELPSTMGPRT